MHVGRFVISKKIDKMNLRLKTSEQSFITVTNRYERFKSQQKHVSLC